MIIIGEKGLSGYIKKFLDLIFIGGIGILLCLPVMLKWYTEKINFNNDKVFYFLLIFLYFTGTVCLWIVLEMRKIFKTLNRRDPFMLDNVISLRKMSMGAFIIALAYVVKIIFYSSILTIVIGMIFIIAGLFLIILAEVFKQAVEFKEENDLTI